MVFSSILFLFVFLPLLIIYYVVPFKIKNLVIMILSMIFYCWGEPKYFFLIILTIVLNYVLMLIIEKNKNKKFEAKIFLSLALVFDIGELFFFKYSNFFIENINYFFGLKIGLLRLTLPLGISFYIFQIMSYVIDVYRGKVKAERDIVDFSAFVVLFPQLIAGPIVKYTDINKELKYRKITMEGIQEGIRLFIMGLGSKVLIANNIGSLWMTIEQMGYKDISSVLAWLGIVSYAMQIYFDFSGYSLMAIGLGKMLGFQFPQNFDTPYISRSVTEFWRRWHITLGMWFKEYLYIPLGGNRRGKGRMIFNLFVVWFATGFWHGANWNFILWGLYFFVFLIIEKMGLIIFLKRHKVISHLYLWLVILISWSLFAITDIKGIKEYIIRMFSFDIRLDWVYYFRNYMIILVIAIIISMGWLKKIDNKMRKNIYIETMVLMIIFILSVAYLVDSTYNPFLYFRF